MRLIAFIILFSLVSCKSVSDAASLPTQEISPAQEKQNPSQAGNENNSPFSKNAPAANLWNMQIRKRGLRLARKDDYKLPANAMSNYDVIRQIASPCTYGYLGPACLLVDDSKNTKNKFSLAIFETGAHPQIHWVYENSDLSSTIISSVKDQYSLFQYSPDGSYRTCELELNKATQKITCQLSHTIKPPKRVQLN